MIKSYVKPSCGNVKREIKRCVRGHCVAYMIEVYEECNFIFYQQGAGLQNKRYHCVFSINMWKKNIYQTASSRVKKEAYHSLKVF